MKSITFRGESNLTVVDIERGEIYVIRNVKGGTVIDLGSDKRTVTGYGFHGGLNQQWKLEKSHGGWNIMNCGNGEYLNIDGEPEDGTAVVGNPSPFIWRIWRDELDQSVFRIYLPDINQHIELSDHGNSTPGTKVTLRPCWEPGENQTWRFERQ